MFRLIRWLLASVFIVAVLAAVAAFRIHGHTLAEVGCKLWENRTCERWARRCDAQVRRAIELFGFDPPHASVHPDKPAPAVVQHEAPKPAAGAPVQTPGAAAVAPVDGPPLDQHSPQDRRTLDHILTSRGSR